MPWNGAGTYAPPGASFPEVNGTVIDATRFNATLNDVASGITNTISKDGQNVAVANLPMGGFVHTGLGQANALGQTLAWGRAGNFTDLTTTGNTILGDSTSDSFNACAGSLIISGGAVGIGVSPAGNAKLDVLTVSGTNRFRVSDVSGSLCFDSVTPTGAAWSTKLERATAFSWFLSGTGVGMTLGTGGLAVNGAVSTAIFSAATSTNFAAEFQSSLANGVFAGFTSAGVVRGYIGSGSALFTSAIPSDFGLRAEANLLFCAGGAGTVRFVMLSDGRIYGTGLHNNAGSVSGPGAQYIASGTYTPTTSFTANISAFSVVGTFQWIRVGNVVTVSGTFSATPTALASTVLHLTLPIPSTFVNQGNGGGAVGGALGSAVVEPATCWAGGAGFNVMAIGFFPVGGAGAARQFGINFTYVIL